MKNSRRKHGKSYLLVNYRISQAGGANIIVGKFTKHCIKYILECIFDENTLKNIEAVPMSKIQSQNKSRMGEFIKFVLISI